MRFTWVPFAFVGVITVVVACSSDGDTSKGTSSGGASSSSGSIGGGTSSSGGTSGGTSSSGGALDSAIESYAKVVCARRQKCQPNSFDVSWATQDECVADVKAANAAGIAALPGTNVGDATIKACAAALDTAVCALGTSNLADCVLKGTLPLGASCYDGRQCEVARCKRVYADADCGVCTAAANEGAACFGTEDCAFGLECDGGKCAKPLEAGAACTDGPPSCKGGLVCAKSKCATAVEIGGACTPAGKECRGGLVCESGACKAPAVKVAVLGASCKDGETCRKSSCRGAPGVETCVAYAAVNAACDLVKNGPPDCDPATDYCVDGKCEANTFPDCK